MVDNTYTHKLWSCEIYHFLNQCWASLFCGKQRLQFLHWEVWQDLLIGTRTRGDNRSQKQDKSAVNNVCPQVLYLIGLCKSYWQSWERERQHKSFHTYTNMLSPSSCGYCFRFLVLKLPSRQQGDVVWPLLIDFTQHFWWNHQKRQNL